MQDNPGALVAPILAAAGTDVSHWCARAVAAISEHNGSSNKLLLAHAPAHTSGAAGRFDADTGEVRTTIDPVTQLPGPYCPQVRDRHSCMQQHAALAVP